MTDDNGAAVKVLFQGLPPGRGADGMTRFPGTVHIQLPLVDGTQVDLRIYDGDTPAAQSGRYADLLFIDRRNRVTDMREVTRETLEAFAEALVREVL
jgi:hypothetical protein